MEFLFEKMSIRIPYSGNKQVAGYLKKESSTRALFFEMSSWHLKYCSLSLPKMQFMYGKNP